MDNKPEEDKSPDVSLLKGTALRQEVKQFTDRTTFHGLRYSMEDSYPLWRK